MTKEQKEMFKQYENVSSIGELTGLEDIPDPYGENLESYINTLTKIKTAVNAVLDKIINLEIN